VQLSDAAGVVEALGSGVTRFAMGDWVVNNFVPGLPCGAVARIRADGRRTAGWMAEYRAVDQNELVCLRDSSSFIDAATPPCAAVTRWNAVDGVGPQHHVLTQGTGGVSLFALQFKARGAAVIAMTSSAEKAERLRALGADHVINYVENPNWGEQARALTGGRGVDRVVEVDGPRHLLAVTESDRAERSGIDGGRAVGRRDAQLLRHVPHFCRFQTIPTGNRQDLEDVITAVACSRIRPVIESGFAFDEGKAAFEHFGKRNVRQGRHHRRGLRNRRSRDGLGPLSTNNTALVRRAGSHLLNPRSI